jgi:hypothetical protein
VIQSLSATIPHNQRVIVFNHFQIIVVAFLNPATKAQGKLSNTFFTFFGINQIFHHTHFTKLRINSLAPVIAICIIFQITLNPAPSQFTISLAWSFIA